MFFRECFGNQKEHIVYRGRCTQFVRNFHEAVDSYLADCSEAGTEPEKAYKGTFNVRVSENLHREAALYGLNNNMSLNSVVENALQNMVEKNFYHAASMVREDTRDFYYRESKTEHDSGELLAGESKNIEYKAERPKDSLKYMKTVIAFSNGEGGKIIFGVDDKTRDVVGIPKDDVFAEMDAITSAISDSCEPMVIPDVYLQTVEEKTIIVVEITPETKTILYQVKGNHGRNLYSVWQELQDLRAENWCKKCILKRRAAPTIA